MRIPTSQKWFTEGSSRKINKSGINFFSLFGLFYTWILVTHILHATFCNLKKNNYKVAFTMNW